MSKDETPGSREERLAAKLRENLKRRKERSRTMAQADNHALSKAPPKS